MVARLGRRLGFERHSTHPVPSYQFVNSVFWVSPPADRAIEMTLCVRNQNSIGRDHTCRVRHVTHCVIGSGPAGVACASALLERGLSVRMIDGGVQLEARRAARVKAMATQPMAEWSVDDIDLIREGVSSSVDGVHVKRIYGSDFPYQEAEERLHLAISDAGVKASLARGGLSNVWGAAMLPYIDRDLVDWPFDAAQLAPHYRAVTSITGISAAVDALAESFPLYSDNPEALRLFQQATAQLDHFQANGVTPSVPRGLCSANRASR